MARERDVVVTTFPEKNIAEAEKRYEELRKSTIHLLAQSASGLCMQQNAKDERGRIEREHASATLPV
jgi:hypothetical protein